MARAVFHGAVPTQHSRHRSQKTQSDNETLSDNHGCDDGGIRGTFTNCHAADPAATFDILEKMVKMHEKYLHISPVFTYTGSHHVMVYDRSSSGVLVQPTVVMLLPASIEPFPLRWNLSMRQRLGGCD